jgi:hypothetical protein
MEGGIELGGGGIELRIWTKGGGGIELGGNWVGHSSSINRYASRSYDLF